MSELEDLYQELILDHNARPRNFGTLPEPTHVARGHNPLCGDQLDLQLQLDADGIVQAVRFNGQGCAISRASASLMTEFMLGKQIELVCQVMRHFRALVTGGEDASDAGMAAAGMGKLAALAGVRHFPMRVKCATLAWHTLQTALAKPGGSVSTEATS